MQTESAQNLLTQIRARAADKVAGDAQGEVADRATQLLDAYKQVRQSAEVAKRQAMQEGLRQQAVQGVWSASKRGLGLGAALAGLVGLRDVMGNESLPVNPMPLNSVEMPVLAAPKKKQQPKLAVDQVSPAAAPSASPPTTLAGMGWPYPAMMAAGGVSALAGVKGVSSLMQAMRKARMRRELEQSKADFAEALESSYKMAADTQPSVMQKLGQELDAVYDLLAAGTEKSADNMWEQMKQLSESGADALGRMGNSLKDTVTGSAGSMRDILTAPIDAGLGTVRALKNTASNAVSGLRPENIVRDLQHAYPNAAGMATTGYGLAALPLAVGGYAAVDHLASKNSRRALLRKAMLERARLQNLHRPTELYAVPLQTDKDDSAEEE
jgi:hypothetical protein